MLIMRWPCGLLAGVDDVIQNTSSSVCSSSLFGSKVDPEVDPAADWSCLVLLQVVWTESFDDDYFTAKSEPAPEGEPAHEGFVPPPTADRTEQQQQQQQKPQVIVIVDISAAVDAAALQLILGFRV
jgi:hypothetical protein